MTVVGTVELLARINTSQYDKDADHLEDKNKKLENSGTKSSSKLSDSFTRVGKVGIAALGAAVVAVGALIVTNIGSAVKRVDTLNNSARTFKNLGFSASDVEKAMKNLDKSIRGLPTSLDEAVRNVQLLAGATNDVGKAQEVFSAVNNAIIGFGGNTEDVSASVIQLTEAISGGVIDSSTWLSLIQNGLGPALGALAKSMGLTTGELKKGLSEGTISVEEFQNALIDMNKKGGGGMASFQKIAKDATAGIGTGWENMKTAITRGIASIIESIGSKNISNAITAVGSAFETALKGVTGFIDFLRENQVFLYALGGLIGGVLVGGVIALGTAIAGFVSGPLLLIMAAFTAIGVLVKVVKDNWDTLGPPILKVWEVMKQLGEFIWGIFKPAIDQMIVAVKEAWAAFQPLWQQIKGPVMEGFKAFAILLGVTVVGPIILLAAAVVAVTYVIIKLITWVSRAAKAIYSFSSSAVKAAVSFASSVVNSVRNVINWFKQLPDRIKTSLGNMGSLLINAGKDLVDGLIRGIKAAPGKVVEAIKSIAKNAKESFKAFLGIKSPSKVFAELGLNITQGLVQGIGSGMGQVDNAISRLSATTVTPTIAADMDGSAASRPRPINVSVKEVNVKGLYARSQADLRDVGKQIIGGVNEELRANQLPQLAPGLSGVGK